MGRKQVESLLKSAKLRLPQADISNIVYENRPLSRELVNQLGTTQFVASATDVILEGFTGTGKSHLACALGKQACKHGIRTMYVRMPDMLAYREERMKAGWAEKKVLRKFASCKVLILDEWLIDKPTTEQMHFLLELTELRYDNSSTIYCSQYSHKDWHRRMGARRARRVRHGPHRAQRRRHRDGRGEHEGADRDKGDLAGWQHS